MQDVTTRSDLDAVLGAPEAILLKHGATCPISANARDELDDFAEQHPDLTIATLEVTGNRDLSDDVTDELGVPHESPQLFLLRDGEVEWHAEHYEITAREIEKQLER